jgi:predicted permease
VSLKQAQTELASVASQIAREIPQNAGRGVTLAGLQETYVSGIRPTLLLLFGSAGVVLLIACANVASLLLARASARGRELTVRVTLGAGRLRLARQLLTESLVLAAAGSLLGTAAAYGLMRALLALAPPGIPRLQTATLDGTVLLFTAAVAALTGVAFGLWPAWQAARISADGLKESSRGSSAARSGARFRKALVVAQVALSLMLLIGANLLILSLTRAQQVDPGYDPEHLLTLRVNLPPPRYSPERAGQFPQEVARNLASLPGVTAAAATTALPQGGLGWGKLLTVEGRPSPGSLNEVPRIQYRLITPDYFRAIGASLRRGRPFTDQDGPTGARIAIVNETLARRFWREPR